MANKLTILNGKILTKGGGLVKYLPTISVSLGLRLPTAVEWEAEWLTWSSDNAAGAFDSALKLTIGGLRHYSNGSISNAGFNGKYWSSTVSGMLSRHMLLNPSIITHMDDFIRGYGFSVRLINDDIYTQAQFNAIAGDTITIAGIIYGFCYNPTTQRIWLDRNLGASKVAASSTDADAYGDLYQWGRATDGHQVRTSTTNTVLSNSDTPGHGDFILTSVWPNDWRSPQNDNLWQGVDGINNPGLLAIV